MKIHQQSIVISMQLLVKNIERTEKVKIGTIFDLLSGKGYPTLLVLFSLPFCIPIQIPGFSTPFGIILAFIGLRLAFARKLWWPKWILARELQTKHVKLFAEKVIQTAKLLQKFFYSRLIFLSENRFFCSLHGILISLLSILLALPLPIPFSNMLAAVPILFIGMGLLEEDGLFILMGYTIALMCFFVFFKLYYLGKAQLVSYFP